MPPAKNSPLPEIPPEILANLYRLAKSQKTLRESQVPLAYKQHFGNDLQYPPARLTEFLRKANLAIKLVKNGTDLLVVPNLANAKQFQRNTSVVRPFDCAPSLTASERKELSTEIENLLTLEMAIDNIPQLKCPKCLGLLRNPILLQCRHFLCHMCSSNSNFCQDSSCLSAIIARINVRQVPATDSQLEQFFLGLRYRCPGRGCNFTGTKELLPYHWKICRFNPVNGPPKGLRARPKAIGVTPKEISAKAAICDSLVEATLKVLQAGPSWAQIAANGSRSRAPSEDLASQKTLPNTSPDSIDPADCDSAISPSESTAAAAPAVLGVARVWMDFNPAALQAEASGFVQWLLKVGVGDIVHILEHQENSEVWVLVSADGRQGWVPTGALKEPTERRTDFLAKLKNIGVLPE